MGFPHCIETARLRLRRPTQADARVVFDRWATDPEVTRYMAWPTHRTLDDSLSFVGLSDAQWERWSAGPYLIETLDGGQTIGSCGVGYHTDSRAEIGYVLRSEAWGLGYATECVRALVAAAGTVAPIELFAPVHPDNAGSMNVLRKCGFEAAMRGAIMRFPNLGSGADVLTPVFVLAVPDGGAG